MDIRIEALSHKNLEIASQLDVLGRSRLSQLCSPLELPQVIISSMTEEERLGYYEHGSHLIVLSQELVEEGPMETVEKVYLHELAHALDYAERGFSQHDDQFKKCCSLLHLENDFSKARIKKGRLEKERIRSKVEKLLSLTSSPYEEESKAALRKAESMMAEHGLKYVKQEKEDEVLYKAVLLEGSRFSHSTKMLLNLLSSMTGVFIIFEPAGYGRNNADREVHRKKVSAYGPLEVLEGAIYLYKNLESELEKACRKEKKLKGASFSSESFKSGLLGALKIRLGQHEETNKALMLSEKKSERLYRRLNSNLRIHTTRSHSSIRSYEDYQRGSLVGKNMELPPKSEKKPKNKQIGYKN